MRRQKRIESYGVQVIRFDETIVLKDIDNVLAEIGYWVLERENNIWKVILNLDLNL